MHVKARMRKSVIVLHLACYSTKKTHFHHVHVLERKTVMSNFRFHVFVHVRATVQF